MRTDTPFPPVVLVFAGPNGSGKSTVSRALPVFGTYVNTDEIKKMHSLTDLEAAEQAEALRYKLVSKKIDFSFETVLSTERNLLLLNKAKQVGYEVQCIYVLTCSADINVSRVRARVAAGGHDVPEDKIRSRYSRALSLLSELISICDKILIYDNSEAPVLIFRRENNISKHYPNKLWSEKKLKKLLKLKTT